MPPHPPRQSPGGRVQSRESMAEGRRDHIGIAPYLPDSLLQRYFGAAVVDTEGAQRALSLFGGHRQEPT